MDTSFSRSLYQLTTPQLDEILRFCQNPKNLVLLQQNPRLVDVVYQGESVCIQGTMYFANFDSGPHVGCVLDDILKNITANPGIIEALKKHRKSFVD